MRVEICDYKTGWFDVEIYLKRHDIENLIRALNELSGSEDGQHFPICNKQLEGPKGICVIEFIRDCEDATDTFQGPLSLAKGDE